MKSILFLVPYPVDWSPSQRFRFEQYFPVLRQSGYSFRVQPFLSKNQKSIQFNKTSALKAGVSIIFGFIKRIGILFLVPFFDRIFVHREATPVGPPFFEWLIVRIFRKRLIYDFDDAIWSTDRIDEPGIVTFFKWRPKVSAICRLSYKVSCGNDYLCSFARRSNPNVVLMPTTIDTKFLHVANASKVKSDRVIIGWTGSSSTLKYLKPLEGALAEILEKYPMVEIMIIADQQPPIELPRLRFLRWSKETEINDLRQFDIGIMPLPDDEWSKGKCGFKALQYMALEIPPVVSPVGVNTVIVSHGNNGFHAANLSEWKRFLSMLIENPSLRDVLGRQAKRDVDDHYSVEANRSVFLSLFE